MHWQTLGVVTALGLAFAQPAAAAGADDKAAKVACIEAAERAQQLSDDHKLSRAQAEALTCSQDGCPAVVKRDCQELLADIKRRIPSIVVRAVGPDGRDLDGSVELDGASAKQLDGTPLTLDPGKHSLVVKADGHAPATEQLIVSEGERSRVVQVKLAPAKKNVAKANPDPAKDPKKDLPTEKKSIPTISLVAGGVGVVGVAGFAYFGLGALSDIDKLQACKPNCTEEQISYPKAKRIAADVSLGVGVIGLAAAVWFYLNPPKSTASTSVGFTPLPGGAAATLGGHL